MAAKEARARKIRKRPTNLPAALEPHTETPQVSPIPGVPGQLLILPTFYGANAEAVRVPYAVFSRGPFGIPRTRDALGG